MVGVGIGFGMKLGVLMKTAFAAVTVVAVLSVLSWERLKAWFLSREPLVKSDQDHTAFSMIEKIRANRYRTVYGIYNERTGKIVEAESVESASLDDTLRSYHREEPLVLYR